MAGAARGLRSLARSNLAPRHGPVAGDMILTVFAGVDVGASRFDCVALNRSLEVVSAEELGSPSEVVSWAEGMEQIAIDAPSDLSTAPHESDEGVSNKFRKARCAEIALGRGYRIWVPWPTPQKDEAPWMSAGFELFRRLRQAGHDPIEVYPYGAFRYLNGLQPLPRKQTDDGIRARIDLLEKRGVGVTARAMSSHHAVDALLAALIAADRSEGTAERVTCDHDGSAIWLPARHEPVLPGLSARD